MPTIVPGGTQPITGSGNDPRDTTLNPKPQTLIRIKGLAWWGIDPRLYIEVLVGGVFRD